jgi:hypothetical protein
MAYVALVAGAVVSRSALLADAVWLVSLLATFFAVITAAVSSGMRRTTAVGFAVLSAAHVTGLYLIPERLPSNRVVSALGYHVQNASNSGNIYVISERSPDPLRPGQKTQHRTYISGSGAIISTANAVVTMLAGLFGYGLAAVAYRHSQHEP